MELETAQLKEVLMKKIMSLSKIFRQLRIMPLQTKQMYCNIYMTMKLQKLL